MKMTSRIGLALLATLAMTSASFAACKDLPTIVTPNTADRFVDQFGPYSGGSQEGGYDYAAQLRVCTDPNSTHRFAAPMRENGACVNTGRHLRSMTSHTGGSPYLGKKNMKDGDVPDIYSHRNGFYIGPVFVPTTGPLPGSC